MKDNIKQRLATLREEYTKGEQLMGEYQQKQLSLQQTLARISGAIQVLEELLGETGGPAEPDREP